MSLVFNTNFVISGVTYVMNQNKIIMGDDVLVLCSRKDATGNMIIAKFVVNGADEKLSSLTPLPGISIPWIKDNTDTDQFYKGQVFLKLSDTEAYVLTHTSNVSWPMTGSNTIWKLTKTGSTYSLTTVRVVPFDSSYPPTTIPFIAANTHFAVAPNNVNIYYMGYDWGMRQDTIYAYNPVTNTLATHTYPVAFQKLYQNSAIYIWNDMVWSINAVGDSCGVPIDSTAGFGIGDDVFFASNSVDIDTPISNFAQPFGTNELWVSYAPDINDPLQITEPYVITYADGVYTQTVYTVTSDFIIFENMGYFGVFAHQRIYSTISLSDTQAIVISSNHGSSYNYSVFVYKVTRDSTTSKLVTTLMLNIPNPNIGVELFRYNGGNYIIFGHGGETAGNGNDVSICRIDENAPPKIKMLNTSVETEEGNTVVINGICLFDTDTLAFESVSLYRDGNTLISVISPEVTPASPAISYSLVVDETNINTAYAFKGIVSGGAMDGIVVTSTPIYISSYFDDISRGHIGAFYFGGSFANGLVDTYDVPVFNLLSVDYSEDVDIVDVRIPMLSLDVPVDTSDVYVYNPFDFDFSAAPRSGSSPFNTSFKIFNYEPKDNYADVWEPYEFHWWFGDNETVVTDVDTTDHVYCGIGGSDGKYYDVSACVRYRLKNR